MNFFGAKGGGQLTRDGIANAQKMCRLASMP